MTERSVQLPTQSESLRELRSTLAGYQDRCTRCKRFVRRDYDGLCVLCAFGKDDALHMWNAKRTRTLCDQSPRDVLNVLEQSERPKIDGMAGCWTCLGKHDGTLRMGV